MDLSRTVYNRDLKIAPMRALDAGASRGEIAREYQATKGVEWWKDHGLFRIRIYSMSSRPVRKTVHVT